MSISEQTSALKVSQRQYVNFVFYGVDPAWRRLPEDVRTQGKQEFLQAVEDYSGKVLVVPYSTIGIRGDCDFMLWRINSTRSAADTSEQNAGRCLGHMTGVSPAVSKTAARAGFM